MEKNNFKQASLVLCIAMIILTSLFICAGLAILEPSKQNMIILSVLSLIGYTGAFVYYLGYKK